MTATITDTAGNNLNPDLALGYATTRYSENIIHKIVGRSNPDVTLRPAALRTGTLRLLFSSEYAANAAVNFHARAAVFTLTDTDLPLSGMRYVLSGKADRELDEETLLRWVVTVDYQEIE